MPDVQRHLDMWSWLIILITLAMFVIALFLKGVSHDLLLEGGVFLVSVKLIMMAYKNSIVAVELKDRLDGLHAVLTHMEGLLESRRSSELAEAPPTSR